MTNPVKGLSLSFYSGTYYGELARSHTGIGAGLIALLTLLTTLLLFLTLIATGQVGQLRDFVQTLPARSQGLPSVTFKDGSLSIDRKVPYKLDISLGNDTYYVVIDTDYKVTDLNTLENYMHSHAILVLVTADKVISRDWNKARENASLLDDPLEIHDLKDTKPFTISHEEWRQMAESLSKWLMTLMSITGFVLMFVFLFIANLFATLLTALVVMVLGLILKEGIEFAAACRLTAAARIPITVLSSLPVVVGHPPLAGLAGWLLWAIYLMFAVMAVRLYGGRRMP